MCNTAPVAIVISLTKAKNALKVWRDIFQLSFPYFVASAGVAAMVLAATAKIGWQVPLFVLPVMFGIFASYRRYFQETVPEPLTVAARSATATGTDPKRFISDLIRAECSMGNIVASSTPQILAQKAQASWGAAGRYRRLAY